MYDRSSLLKLTCPSDWDGQWLPEGGIIGLRTIEFNCTRWEAPQEISSITILDGEKLIIRREGRHIFIEREPREL